MPRRKDQIGKRRRSAHLPQISIAIGRGGAHIVGNQITGHGHGTGAVLHITGIEHFQVNGFQVVFCRGLLQKIPGTIRQLLRRAGHKAAGAQALVHDLRVKTAVTVGCPQKQRVDLAALGIQLPQHHAGIGVDVIHQQKIKAQAQNHRQRRKRQRGGQAAQPAVLRDVWFHAGTSFL